jgi:hypothetical protein
MIGDVNNPIVDEAVVVDPWPAKGFAVLYDHWEYKGAKLAVTFGPTRSQGQTPLKAARAKLNASEHTKRAFDVGLREAYDQYGTGEEMRGKIKEIYQAGLLDPSKRYFWGNEHTLSEKGREFLDRYYEQKRALVTDPLSLDPLEFELLYG